MPPLPPPLSTADEGSFARRTIVERKPRIVAQVLESPRVPAGVRGALESLVEEIRGGTVVDPLDGAPQPQGAFEPAELGAWKAEIARQAGRRWLDLPWYFAEAYFYLRLLLAWGYYGMRAAGLACAPDGRPADPFHLQKEEELTGAGQGIALARRVAGEAAGAGSDRQALSFLVNASLWGNRVDLGCHELDESRRREVLSQGREALVVDHTDALLDAIDRGRRVDMVLDNAGSELACDLLLADRLLGPAGHGAAPRTVVLHVKRTPFFVSDTTLEDLRSTLDAFFSDPDPALSAAGTRLVEASRAGRLLQREHWFWSSPLHFPRMPVDLAGALAAADLVVLKGDANYRRLLEDRRWEHGSSMEEIAAWFPAPLACLRTLKSEIAVDIPPDEQARLQAEDPQWLTNGRRGIVRYCRAGRAGNPLPGGLTR
jgi:hypothetical protein